MRFGNRSRLRHALLGATLATAASCGAQSARPPAPAASVDVGLAFDAIDRTADEIQETWEQIMGTPTQLGNITTAGEMAAHEAVAACFRESGVRYTMAPSTGGGFAGREVRSLPLEYTMLAPLEDGTTAGLPLSASFNWAKAYEHEQFIRDADDRAAELSKAERERLPDVATRCHPLLGDHAVNIHLLMDAELEADFLAMLDVAERRVAENDKDYAACMHEGGFDVDDRRELYDLVLWSYFDEYTSFAVAPESSAYRSAKDQQDRAIEVDTACRQDKRAEALVLVEPLLAEFRAANASRLSAQQDRWRIAAEQAEVELSRLEAGS